MGPTTGMKMGCGLHGLALKGHGRDPTLKGHDGKQGHPFSSAGVAVRRVAMEDCGRMAAYDDCGRGGYPRMGVGAGDGLAKVGAMTLKGRHDGETLARGYLAITIGITSAPGLR